MISLPNRTIPDPRLNAVNVNQNSITNIKKIPKADLLFRPKVAFTTHDENVVNAPHTPNRSSNQLDEIKIDGLVNQIVENHIS